MNQLNIRNVDERLWCQVKARAAAANQPVGELLNRILEEWLDSQNNKPPADALERARKARGILADLAPGVSFVEELFKMRREDVEKEEREFQEYQRRKANSDSSGKRLR
jgi:plasmid stability protein